MEFVVKTMRRYEKEGSKIKAFADVMIGGLFVIRGIRVIEDNNNNSYYAMLPDKLNKKTNIWEEIVSIEDMELKQAMLNKVVALYMTLPKTEVKNA